MPVTSVLVRARRRDKQRRSRSGVAGPRGGRAAVRGPLSRPRLRRAAAGLSCNRRTCRPGIGRPSVTLGPHGGPGELMLGSAWRPRLFLTLLPERWPLGLSDGTHVSCHHSVPEGTALQCGVLPPGVRGTRSSHSYLHANPLCAQTRSVSTSGGWARPGCHSCASGTEGRVCLAWAWPTAGAGGRF